MNRFSRSAALCASFGAMALVLILVPCAHAADAVTPEEQLLRLVDKDVGICIQATDLQAHVSTFLNSEMVQRFQKTSFFREWEQSAEFRQLQEVQRGIAFLTGKAAEKFTAEIFGQSMVLALFPPEGTTETEPVGVFLTYARSPKALEEAIAAWNKADKHTTKTVKHLAYTYHHRVNHPGAQNEEVIFYTTFGNVFALSDNQNAIQKVIELHNAQTNSRANQQDESIAGDCLWNSRSYQQIKSEFGNKTVATAYINPRSWDRLIAKSQQPNDPVEKLMMRGWQHTQAIMFGVRQERGLVADLVVQYNDAAPSEAWNRITNRTRGKAEFLQKVPQHAMLIAAGRVDLTNMEQLIFQNMQPAQVSSFRQLSKGLLLGLDLFDDVLPQLGPNWGAYAVPRKELNLNTVPFEGLFAIQLPPPTSEEKASRLRLGLNSGLNTAFNFLAAFNNRQQGEKPAEVETYKADNGTVRWINSLRAYQPAYCLTPGYLVFATHPDLVKEFLTAPQPDSKHLAHHPAFHRANQVVIFRGDLLREFLLENKVFFLKQAAELARATSAEAPKVQFERLTDLVSLLQFVHFSVHEEKSQFRFTWGLQTAP